MQLCVPTVRRYHLTSADINTPIESRQNHDEYSNRHDRDILSLLFSSYTNILRIAATLKKLIALIIYLFPITVVNVNEIVNLDHRALLRRVYMIYYYYSYLKNSAKFLRNSCWKYKHEARVIRVSHEGGSI